ncbi:MAG: pyrroline-5-carboxylate reductase [Planctomycetes bacterium]|nr:pyrroline-5-carboxylate reductase [Planctomycetota bacterium]
MTSMNMGYSRIGFIGAGRMATALTRGVLTAGLTTADALIASDVSADARRAFQESTGVRAVESNAEVAQNADVIILSVKPQQMTAVLEGLQPQLTESHLLVSIAAGISLKTIEEKLASKIRLIRVMPNTPCLLGVGASAFAAGVHASADDIAFVERFLSTVGLAVEVKEPLLDAVTGLSGSGPAYVYLVIEALSDGGVRVGLPRDVAVQLAAQTVLGAARMVLETGEHPAALKDAVTSPGGTTIAGLHVLEQGGLRGCLMTAVQAATARSRELGQS